MASSPTNSSEGRISTYVRTGWPAALTGNTDDKAIVPLRKGTCSVRERSVLHFCHWDIDGAMAAIKLVYLLREGEQGTEIAFPGNL